MISQLQSHLRSRPRTSARGQVLVIVAVGMVVFVGMVALVVDGGHAWGQQRDAQNGADATSLQGALMLAENQPYRIKGEAQPNTDTGIEAELFVMAGKNDLVLDEAYYTEFDGDRLAGPISVGSLGSLPPPAAAYGVEVVGHKEFDTFLASVIGWDTLTASVTATAATGPIEGFGGETVLPVTFPVTITDFDGRDDAVQDPAGRRWELNTYYVVPLCGSGPGNVGWIDWDPTGGGMSELIAAVNNYDNDPITIPEWYWVTSTGNQSTPGLEAALNQYATPPDPHSNKPPGFTVMIPLFDSTCEDEPTNSGVEPNTGGDRPCDHDPGHGSNFWYHFYDWTAFEIDWVDLNGKDKCDLTHLVPGTTGNGATGCFAGHFRQYMGPGILGTPDGSETEFTLWGTDLDQVAPAASVVNGGEGASVRKADRGAFRSGSP